MPRLDTPHCPPTTVCRCQVAAWSAVQAGPELLAQWRAQPPPLTGQPLPASFVKHSEDQTLAALAAVHAALGQHGWQGRTFTDWGVLAAPNFLGRGGNAYSLQRYAQEGAWGVSPHVIPHHSLHAVSGTLSQVLKMHGPNFGIGGGGQSVCDAFLIATAMLAEGMVPGVWLLLSGHDREWVPVENPKSVEPARPPLCEAAALALVPAALATAAATVATAEQDGLYLRVGPDMSRAWANEFALSGLVAALRRPGGPVSTTWRLPGAGWVELEVVTLGVGSRW
jgi:hypothetical protein